MLETLSTGDVKLKNLQNLYFYNYLHGKMHISSTVKLKLKLCYLCLLCIIVALKFRVERFTILPRESVKVIIR